MIVPPMGAMWPGLCDVSCLLVEAGVWICCVGCMGYGVAVELARTLLGGCRWMFVVCFVVRSALLV